MGTEVDPPRTEDILAPGAPLASAVGTADASSPREPGPGGEMTLVEHLEELRWRIIKSAVAVAIGFALCFWFNQPIIGWLLSPALKVAGISSGSLIFTTPAEYFMAAVKVAFFGGIYMALPIILYQVIAFVSPGLTETERKWAVPMTVGAALLFTLGGAFSYWGLLPICLRFLVGFAPTTIVHPMLTVGSVLTFTTLFLFATGVVFQLPLILLGLALLGVVNSRMLTRFRKFSILIAFAAGAILTPSPDVFSTTLLALALIVLYETSVVLIRLAGR